MSNPGLLGLLSLLLLDFCFDCSVFFVRGLNFRLLVWMVRLLYSCSLSLE